jgi:hypothetical protein
VRSGRAHDLSPRRLPDEAYEKVVRAVEAEADADEATAARLRDGLADLDGDGSFAGLDADARLDAIRAIEGSSSSSSCTPPRRSSSTTTRSCGRPSDTRARRRTSAATSTGASPTSTGCPTPPLALDPAAGSHHR